MTESKPKRRWFRFSLRTFLVVVMVFGGWLGLTLSAARQQRESVLAIRNAGGEASYFNGYRDGEILHGSRPHGPRWLLDLLGYDFFADIIVVVLDGDKVTDEQIAFLKHLHSLQYLSLSNTRITELGLAQLRNFPKLEIVDLSETPISVAGFEQLGKLPALKKLRLARTPLTDEGLRFLSKICTLQELFIPETNVTQEGEESFRKQMPNCVITH